MTGHELERRTIREAMTRLLEGEPVRSDGKLTIKSLAQEAGVKRSVLTHRHTDLQGEFRNRIAQHGVEPEPVRLLKECVRDLEQQYKRLRGQLREAKPTTAMLEWHIAVEALETTHGPADAHPGPARLRPVPDPIQPGEEPPTDPRG